MTNKQHLLNSINDLLEHIDSTLPAIPGSVEGLDDDITPEDYVLAQQHAIAALGAAASLDAHVAGVMAALGIEEEEEEDEDDVQYVG